MTGVSSSHTAAAESSGTRRAEELAREKLGRRARLIDAAIECIATRGVSGTSHRQIAAIAAVPLGSTTYYFATLEDLLLAAFDRVALQQSDTFDRRVSAARTVDELVEILTELVHQDLQHSARDQVLTYELYAQAVRDPRYKLITQRWMGRTRASLRNHLGATTALAVDAYLEGAALHLAMDPEPREPDLTRSCFKSLITSVGGTSRVPVEANASPRPEDA